MKLILGTAQFGLNYGVANTVGKIQVNEIIKIINTSNKNNIDQIDTAMSYGDAEEILGNIGVQNFKIDTKVVLDNDFFQNPKIIKSKILNSLKKLKVSKLNTLLIHNTAEISKSNLLTASSFFNELKNDNLITNFGFSIYTLDEIDEILDTAEFDCVQIPYNIFDRRLSFHPARIRLMRKSIKIIARSVFLQGLLLLNRTNRPSYFDKWNDSLKIWDEWLDDKKVLPYEVCIAFVKKNKFIDGIVIGIDSNEHLEKIINARPINLDDMPNLDFSNDLDLINPSLWKL
jgi:aryl-alcohol dehydrogenase-like predicted oxidoreductase